MIAAALAAACVPHAASPPDPASLSVGELRAAAEGGTPAAQLDLARRYAEGRGLPRDAINAYAWFTIAAAAGSTEAEEERDLLARTMTAEEIDHAERIAREWGKFLFIDSMRPR